MWKIVHMNTQLTMLVFVWHERVCEWTWRECEHGSVVSSMYLPVQQLSSGYKFSNKVHLARGDVHVLQLNAIWVVHLKGVRVK